MVIKAADLTKFLRWCDHGCAGECDLHLLLTCYVKFWTYCAYFNLSNVCIEEVLDITHSHLTWQAGAYFRLGEYRQFYVWGERVEINRKLHGALHESLQIAMN